MWRYVDLVELWWRCGGVVVVMCRSVDVEWMWRCGNVVEMCRCGDVEMW